MNTTTTNLADFGHRERSMLVELLNAWSASGLPDDFDAEQVRPMLNTDSGYVFLTNAEYQVAMINAETYTLESFYSTPYEGREGFWSELVAEYSDMHPEDQEYMRDIAMGRDIPGVGDDDD